MAYQQFQLIIPYQGFCYWTDPKQENIIKSIFKQKIFSMQFVELVFQGDHSPSFFYQKISVINFDSLRIQDTLFLVQQQLQIYQNNDDNKLQDLIITNSVFFNDLNLPVKLQIISKNCQNINFTNLQFNNLNFLDSNIFEITPYGIQSIFTINKFTIENCIFTNTILFKIKNTSKIIISNLILNNCYFTNSSIANFEFDYNDPSNIQFHYLMIKNSVFIQSSIISNVVSLALMNISILLSKFEFTQIIEFKKDLNIKNISIKGNNFIQSQLIFKSPVKQLESKVIINSLIFEDNFHYNSSIFQTDLTLSNDLLSISFINFYLNQNQKIQLENQSNYLFNINSHNFSIYNLSISNSDNFNYFNLITITNIKVEYAIFVNLQTLHKVPILLECVNSFNINNQLFYIQGFNSLQFISITIKNFKSIDRSFIQIFSNLLTKEQEFINIQDLRFIENTLLKINLRNLFSLISIYSEKSQLIIINNIQFQENVYHQYIDDSSQTTASLLFIISQQSSVIITNLSCSQNILTNSTSSFIYINSKIINISEFQIQKHNILNMTTLYSLFEIKNIINQNQINTILLKVLKIQNTGGVLSFTTEDCTIINGILQYILTLNSKLFNIHTQGKGIIKIKKLEINLIESLDLNIAENEGCITINSQSSLLQLELTNILFTDILNKFASPILFIIPSQNINNIVIKNITIFNCFSLTNLLIKTQFSLMSIKNNKVLIQNVKIIQNKLEFKQYLQKFNTLSLIDRQKILNDNAIINLSGCIIIIKQFRYQGVLSSSILKLIDTYKVQMVKIYFIQIQLILKVDLIHIWHSPNNKYTVMIQDLTFQNITQLDQIEFLNLSYDYNKIEILNQNCSLINEIQIQSLKINDIGFDTFFQQLIQDSNQQGSLIYFQSQSILNKIFLSSIQAMNVNSQQLFNAILLFDLISFSSIDIIEFNCLFNSVNLYGCILAQQSDKLNSIIRITNSFFYKNNGGSGTGIKTKNVKLALYNSKLLNNYAQIQGGGLNLQLDQNEFVIINSQIQLNQANEAGGIYLLGNSNINENNFIKSVISLNKANLSPSNLLELPTHLSLSINQQDMLSIQKYIDNIQINILKLDPYQIIEQGKVIITNLLVLPSNQIIKNYQIFNPNDQSFQKYIQEFSISFKNNLNEKLIQFTNSTCKIQEQIFTYNKLEYTKLPQIIKFNTLFGNFDISQLQFSFDPYMEISQQQQLLIICQPNNSFSELQYGIKIATLKCQLGEFYIQNSCQTCQYKQGYYSVTYNSTKCSIFDKNKFYNITSNQINLKVGYWRPNYYSDDVEYCFKYPNICKGGWFVGDNLCFSGYIGGLCEECDKYNIRGEGYYYKNQYNLQCQLCEGLSNRILLFIVASLWSLGSIILTLSSIEKSNKLFISCKLRQRFSNIIFKLNQDHGSIIIKLFLNYLWIFSAIFSLNINFTFSFNFIDQTSNPSYFMANNLDCFLLQIHNIELIYLRIITMFILMISLLILIYLGFLFIELFYEKKFDASIISITALYLYVSNYAALIKQFFSLLAKRQISNINYIQGDVSLKFGTSDHIKWMISFIIPGLGLIGWLLPFLLLLLLYVKKDQIESIQFRKHFCYLFNEYNNSNFFWEWVKLAKKTSVIIILTYFETNIYLKATLLGLCLLFYQLYALEQQPYIIQNFNKIDVKAGQICSISIFLAVIKYICEQQDNFVLSFILQMILVLLSIKLSFPFINSLLKLYHKKYKRQFLIQLSKIFNIFQCTSCLNKYLKNKIYIWNQKEQRLRSNFYKLRHHLIYISKLQLEQQKSLTTLFTSESLPRHKQYTTELYLLKFRQDIH
ncbi:unnamed protein product [Paramecium primaurelia]|uniref:Transmembrane protein n=1 Tax=Paramecium primaurelia TaxID=5886 RepID=A0A8S1M666_PARPR|nr:unnamed protein product [Paramecium primaurelia]